MEVPYELLADGSKIIRKKGIALFRYGERVGALMSYSVKKATAPFWALSRLRRWASRLTHSPRTKAAPYDTSS